MLGSRGRMSAVMASLAIMGVGFGGAAMATEVVPTWEQYQPPRFASGPMLYATTRRSNKTAAQQKRASKKARNVSRHKKHAR